MITTALCLVALSSPGDYRKNLNMYMEAERAFARTAALKGFRASFMEWFAEDGLGFNPHPVKQKEELAKLPEETKPFKTLLTWEPKIADCSSTADLGFTTGPYRVINLADSKDPIRNGSYFSVWQKQPDGMLRVIFDLGTPMAAVPVYPDRMKVQGPPSPAFVTMDLIDRAKQVIKSGEEDISKSTPAELAKTYGLLYNKEVVIYHPGSPPLLSALEGRKWFEDNSLELKEWAIKDTKISISGDLGFVWGSYSGTQKGEPTKGYFGHVWKCEIGKGWHIIADVMSVVPPVKG